MKLTHIAVTAARGFNHPYEQFANFKFDLHLAANLEPDEDPDAAIIKLQANAEECAEQHKARILADLKRKREIGEVLDSLRYAKRSMAENETTQKTVADLEARLSALTSEPLMIGGKTIHAGHPDHPETNNFDNEP
ncbi:MAG: hypothetical protein ACYC67_10340 [Prosthecobacter sp.]